MPEMDFIGSTEHVLFRNSEIALFDLQIYLKEIGQKAAADVVYDARVKVGSAENIIRHAYKYGELPK